MTRTSGTSGARHAVVVGGSLTGLCTALALSRDGWRVTVLERSATGGQGQGISVDRGLLSSVTGVDASRLPVIQTGFPATGWGLLRSLLAEGLAARQAVQLHRSTAVTEVGADDRGAVVHTPDGDVRADLVVGADGVASTVRRWVSPGSPHAVYGGIILWRGLVEEREVPGGLGRDLGFALRDADVGLLGTYGIPGAEGEVGAGRRRGAFIWFDASRTPLLRAARVLQGSVVTGSLIGQDVPGDVVHELRRWAGRWPEPWRSAIRGRLSARDFIGTPVAEHLPDRLVEGAVALVGDAAHAVSPVTGAGFHNGLLDVAALTAALREAGSGHVGEALLSYQRSRLQLARQVVTQSRGWSTDWVRAWSGTAARTA